MMKNIAVVGATGLVGETVVRLLEERNFPVGNLRLFSSLKSEGREIAFRGAPVPVEVLAPDCFAETDIAFFCLDAKLAKEWVPAARKTAVVIDKSSAFRLEPDVPLVVPEVNPHALKNHKNLAAVPNCTTIPFAMVLAALGKAAKIRRVVAASYQSVSGAGRDAVEELSLQVEKIAAGEPVKPEDVSVLPRPIGANVIPQIEQFLDSRDTTEEIKLTLETRKILDIPDLRVTATCVRVPVVTGHAIAVNVEFEQRLTVKDAERLLAGTAGIQLVQHPGYPTPLDAAGRDEVLVGRIREDLTAPGLNLWLVADNLRKGAALNGVQIAELLSP